jgi:PAS domain S-box-containing protein
MEKGKHTSSSSGLRRKATDRLGKKNSCQPGNSEDTHRLVHELQVHQIELEIQNEELRQAMDEVETVRAGYADLYDFAPIGYFTLDRNTVILQVNLTGASLLGLERQRLVKKRFKSLITPDSLPVFNAFFHNVFICSEKQTCEISILRGSQLLTLRLEAIADESGHECRAIAMDITENKRMEELVRVRMHLMEYAPWHTLEEVLRETLDNVGHLVRSPVGFYHFVAPDEK